MRFFVAVAISLAILSNNVVGQTCFFPDGSSADGETAPCDTSAENSHCCGRSDLCLSNGYCLQSTDVYANRIARGACTSQLFPQGSCPQYCSDVERQKATVLFLASDDLGGKFCCSAPYNTTTEKCQYETHDSGYEPFNLDLGRPINDRSTGSVNPNVTEACSSGEARSTTTVTETASSTARPTGAGASNTEGGEEDSCPSASASNSDSNTTTIAAGIAVPLSALFLAALAAAAIFYRQTRSLKRQLADEQRRRPGYHGAPVQTGYGKPQAELVGQYPQNELGGSTPVGSGSSPMSETEGRQLAEVHGTPLHGTSLMKR